LLFVICYLLFVICYLLFVICYLLFVICYLLFVICYLLFVICYLLLEEAEPLGIYSQALPGNKELLFLPSSFFLLPSSFLSTSKCDNRVEFRSLFCGYDAEE